jgi:predicted negative regulator of RcsB-dependent stress response
MKRMTEEKLTPQIEALIREKKAIRKETEELQDKYRTLYAEYVEIENSLKGKKREIESIDLKGAREELNKINAQIERGRTQIETERRLFDVKQADFEKRVASIEGDLYNQKKKIEERERELSCHSE